MKRAVQIVALSCGFYLLSYGVLSLFGAYAPAVWGYRGWKSYQWAPPGFYDPATREWSRALTVVYSPLHYVDRRLWHDHEKYPDDRDPQYPR
jgi:hypothetical protein